ncbi:MAG: DMP19 family protein [Pyrinomonadaceae bacterium]|nr:DMP19 family protein [Pyrinomonadaceae bacterium]
MSRGNEEQVVRLVERFQANVAAHGFEGFFHGDAGDFTQATLNALLVLKATDAAALLRRAMWVFEDAAPPSDQRARRVALGQIGETERLVLQQLDRSFRNHYDDLARSLARYSRSLDERYCVA